MSNDYYSATGNPATGSEGLSAVVRAEFILIQAAFDDLPVVTGNANRAIVVNAGGTALTVTTGTFALAGNFATTGAFNTTLAQGASVTLTLPLLSGTLATLAGTETLSNKTLVAPALGTPASGVATNLTGTAAGLTAGNATTATNVSGGAASVTTLAASGAVSGAGFIARFSTPGPIGDSVASTGAFTTLAASSTVSGVGFTARFSTPGPIGDSSASTGAFTTLAASSTVSGAGFTARFSTPGPIGDSSASTGAFTTLAASSTVSGTGFTARFATPGPIGNTSASTGAFTTVSASGQVTSTVSTGTAPFVVASTTNVANLNAASLSGATFAAPGAIGGGTPSTGAFTTLTASTAGTTGTQVVNFSQFNPSVVASGYTLLPGGLIFQWGSGTTPIGGAVAVGFPITFPAAVFSLTISVVGPGFGNGVVATVPTTAGFNAITGNNSTGVQGGPVLFHWKATGA